MGEMKPEASRPKRSKSGYLPGLDGWRALAILGVIATHDHPDYRPPFGGFQGFGGYGVYLFFAISGILICTRILEEEAAIGHFRLWPFYVRRLFRIQPAALTYLLAIALLTIFGVFRQDWHFWIGALLLYTNFLFRVSDTTGMGAFTGHFWTLSVEEHFYILLSLLLFCFRRHRIPIFAGVFIALWLGAMLGRRLNYFDPDISTRRTYWVIAYLVFPSLLALLLKRPGVRALCDRFLHPWVAYLLTLIAMLCERLLHHHTPLWSARGLLASDSSYLFFGFAFWVIATMIHPRSLSTRFLELAPLKWFGRLSYSIYLWHVLFFVSSFTPISIHSHLLVMLAERPWRYVASVFFAMLSYYLVEKPLIRLGHTIAPPVSPGHMDLDALPHSQPASSLGAPAPPARI